ncbi:MAG: hypothetical protein HY077_14995 [Elusimicrobia bacterium]|nr:hypothetical protein [Elusimicrobiota bacterium]
MKTTSPRSLAALVCLSLLLTSVAPAAPAMAGSFETAPARVAPTVLPVRSVSFSYSPSAVTQLPGAAAGQIGLPVSEVSAQALAAPVTMEAALPAPLASLEAPRGPVPDLSSLFGSSVQKQSWVSRVKDAVKGEIPWSQVFDFSGRDSLSAFPSMAMGIRPLPEPTLPAGVKLDPPPAAPDPKKVPGVTIEGFFAVPGSKTPGGVFDAGPRLLKADPSQPKDVERALREMIDLDAAKYGLTSAELSTVHAEFRKYATHQTDTVFVLFSQTRESKNPNGTVERVPIHGARLSFTVKNVNGNAVLYSSMGKLYPNIAVNTDRTLTDDQLKGQAEKRLGIPPNSTHELHFIERKIIYSQGSWHTANLYVIDGFPVMIAVDVATGDAFAWDPRMGAQSEDQATAAILGRGETSDVRQNGVPTLVPQGMNNLTITMADGSKVDTNTQGKLVVVSKDGKEVAFEAALEGTFARVKDAQGRTLKINGAVKPGTEGEFVYNPKDAEEWVYNLINTFQGINRVHDWLYARFPDKRINRDIQGTANIDQECNAYYTPGRPSLNFFRSSANCSDTGRPGIIAHEYGHFWDDMIGGIVNGGLSEGWGDILSMFIFGSPIIGDGFLKNTTNTFPANFLTRWIARIPLVGGLVEPFRPSYIRHGENTYQFKEYDEVHAQGQAWMGFAWKLRLSLIAKLGEAAGAAMAESLIIPTMLAKAGDIPAAMAQVLLNDMDKNGLMPHEAEIRAAAKAHGIDLPKAPGAITTLVNRMTAPLSRVSFKEASAQVQKAVPVATLTAGVAPESTGAQTVSAKLTFSAGALIRTRVRNEIAKYCDFHGLKYSLKEYKGWLSSDFLLSVEGPQDKVEYLLKQIQQWGSNS